MKKLITVLACATMVLGLGGCGSGDDKPKEKVFIDESEIASMYSSPSKYEGKYVTLTGKIFSSPEEDDGLIAFQMWGDVVNNDKNTIVGCEKEICSAINTDEYVKVTGYIVGEYEGENMMGGKIKAPQIKAESVEKSSYMDTVSPTIKAVDANAVQSQNSVELTLSKVEFAENETRIYLSINNQSNNKFNFYTFNAKITQNGKQYEEDRNYESDYPEISSEILPGIKSEGIIAFPKMEQSDFKLICEGHTDDYSVDFTDYTFDISVK